MKEFTPEELEFIAMDEIVSIVPKIKMDKIKCMQGTFGPFLPPFRKEVPIWMALELRTRGLCQITPPEWMDTGF
jgi:GINS complex subunit 2